MARSKWLAERDVFQEILRSVGCWNVTAKSYSDESGVPLKTVQKWLTSFRQTEGRAQLNKLGKDIPLMSDSALRIIAKHMISEDPKISLAAAEKLISAQKGVLELYEKLGHKEVVATEGNVTINNLNSNLFANLTEQQRRDIARNLMGGPDGN